MTCRFGRGCLFAHSEEELEEWIQEFQRKERERTRKEREGRDETSSLEMASKVLNGPAEDVSPDKLRCALISSGYFSQVFENCKAKRSGNCS